MLSDLSRKQQTNIVSGASRMEPALQQDRVSYELGEVFHSVMDISFKLSILGIFFFPGCQGTLKSCETFLIAGREHWKSEGELERVCWIGIQKA